MTFEEAILSYFDFPLIGGRAALIFFLEVCGDTLVFYFPEIYA